MKGFRGIACLLAALAAPWCRTVAASQESPDAITEITLERGVYGRSDGIPNYKITLRKDGAATYEGRGLLQLKGKYRGEIKREDFRKLAEFFAEKNFFLLPDYDESRPRLVHISVILISAVRPGGPQTRRPGGRAGRAAEDGGFRVDA